MTTNRYNHLAEPFRRYPFLLSLLKGTNRALTLSCYIWYPIFLVLVFFYWPHPLFFRALLVPAVSFVALSFFRARISAPRPYEVLDIVPLIQKDTTGKSFPSRHVFSVFVIAGTTLYFFPTIGIVLLVFGLLLSVIRVLGGVHFPRDVIWGGIIGFLSAYVGMWLIP